MIIVLGVSQVELTTLPSRPGFVRLNLPYFMNEEELEYIIKAVRMLSENAWKMLPLVSNAVGGGEGGGRQGGMEGEGERERGGEIERDRKSVV